jgi:hypothetical protein
MSRRGRDDVVRCVNGLFIERRQTDRVVRVVEAFGESRPVDLVVQGEVAQLTPARALDHELPHVKNES